MRKLNLDIKEEKFYQYSISCHFVNGACGIYTYNSKKQLNLGDYVKVDNEYIVGKVDAFIRQYDSHKAKPNAKFISKISKKEYDDLLKDFPRILERQEAFGRYLEIVLNLRDALWQ